MEHHAMMLVPRFGVVPDVDDVPRLVRLAVSVLSSCRHHSVRRSFLLLKVRWGRWNLTPNVGRRVRGEVYR